MTEWIIIGVLYALALLSFRFLGGMASAADAFRTWGAASSDRFRTAAGSSSA